MNKYKTTEMHFKIFQEECLKWLKRFGLFFDYEIEFRHVFFTLKAEAMVEYNVEDRWAVIYLRPTWNDTVLNTFSIKRAAFHEACELLLGKLNTLAENDSVNVQDVNEATHKIIRVLEQAFWFITTDKKDKE